jgi:hypothetical protein
MYGLKNSRRNGPRDTAGTKKEKVVKRRKREGMIRVVD